jgi:undecaprenyl pyrophosphate phosphatase UppP
MSEPVTVRPAAMNERPSTTARTGICAGFAAAVGGSVAVVAAALPPELSRSGLTIAIAPAVGMHRELATECSFFVAIPIILAAAALQAVDIARDETLSLAIDPSAYVIGFVVAAGVGAGTLLVVLRLLYQARCRISRRMTTAATRDSVSPAGCLSVARSLRTGEQ